MPFIKPRRPPEVIALARQMYADGERIEDIGKATGMSDGGIYYWVNGGPKEGPGRLPPLPRRTFLLETPAPAPRTATPNNTASVEAASGEANDAAQDDTAPEAATPQRRRRTFSGDRIAMVKRLWRAAEVQVRDIGERLTQLDGPLRERDRNLRSVAILVKTMRELATLAEPKQGAVPPADSQNDDAHTDTRSIEEFRRELARRMDEIVARRTAGPAGGAFGT
jgi:hypothetical protein